jgi:tRNA 2-selenouridine synthase
VQLLQGGYRSYRRLVVQTLYDTPLPHRLMVIEGGTGTAKTALLRHLAEQGAQTIDLEGLAAHRGSLFGATDRPQPAQKLFDSQIAAALAPFDPARPIWVEAESSRIGQRTLPPSLWSAMQAAPRVEITAPTHARADYLSRAYRDLTADPDQLSRRIDHLRPYHASETIADWHALALARDWTALAEALITAHYDPRYTKSAARAAPAVRRHDLSRLDPETLDRTAAALIAEFS